MGQYGDAKPMSYTCTHMTHDISQVCLALITAMIGQPRVASCAARRDTVRRMRRVPEI